MLTFDRGCVCFCW